jgi:cyclin A
LLPVVHYESSATSPTSCLIDKLPDETLQLILSFLPRHDAHTTRLVCLLWDKLARDICLRYTPILDDFLQYSETEYRVSPDYMRPIQKDITPSMRAILVDWLIEVADEFGFRSETLFLCINYLDRYLSVQQVPRSKLQLVGIVCLIIAAKFEEIQVPRIEEFVFLSDNTCTREEVFAVEVHVLAKLSYFLVAATAYSFLSKYLTFINVCITAKLGIDKLSNHLIRLAALDYGMLKYSPSLVAASAVCLALHTHQCTPWTFTLERITKRSIAEKEMQLCVADLHALFEHGSKPERAAFRKFQSSYPKGPLPEPPNSLPRLSNAFLLPPDPVLNAP